MKKTTTRKGFRVETNTEDFETTNITKAFKKIEDLVKEM